MKIIMTNLKTCIGNNHQSHLPAGDMAENDIDAFLGKQPADGGGGIYAASQLNLHIMARPARQGMQLA